MQPDLHRRAAAPPLSPTPEIRVDRRAAADDTDTATRQTVEMMCEYIRTAAADPMVRACALYAWRRFGGGSADPALKAWGVYWWVKHCIAFRQDEATMFRVGERNQQDLLTAPQVLFRMKDPAEDCDGFTMAEAALLCVLDVPVVIATVAADPSDKTRWSHVFPVALVNGKPLPLDASHGLGPGWMIPPRDLFRWQAWNLDAQPVDVEPMRHQGLHGYVSAGRPGLGAASAGRLVSRGGGRRRDYFPGGRRPVRVPLMFRRGMGDCVTDPESGLVDCSGSGVFTPSGGGGGYTAQFPSVTGGGGSTSAPFNWNTFLNNLVGTAGQVARVAETPTTTVSYPGGPTITGPAGQVGPSLLGSASFSSMLPLLGIGLVGLLALSAMGKK